MIRQFLIMATASLTLLACSGANEAKDAISDTQKTVTNAVNSVTDNAENITADVAANKVDKVKLSEIVAAQPETVKARYGARHPVETLEFFGVKPGMTIVEVLPGGGWYTKIISPYVGTEGHIVGVDYSLEMWPEFGGFATPEFIETRKGWTESWLQDMHEDLSGEHSPLSAYTLTSLPDDLKGQADMVIMIRALHNLARFNEKGGYMDTALAELYDILKPGGLAGIVQHHAPEENDDKWADGNNGYLKKSYVIAQMEKAGFEFIEESDVNANPRDIPSNKENVWRLPPTLGTSREDADLRSNMEAIGESNRMTLKFMKPE